MPSFSPFPPPIPASRFLLPRYLAIQSIPVSASPYKDAQLVLLKVERTQPLQVLTRAPLSRGWSTPLFALSPSPRSISPRAIHVGARKGGKSRWGEEEHETNERERESLGNGRSGGNGSNGGVRCHEPSSLLDGRWTASITPSSPSHAHTPTCYVFACQRWAAMQSSGKQCEEMRTDRPTTLFPTRIGKLFF